MRSGWFRAGSAWFWSLQFALLNPVLAVLLTSSFGASGAQAGLVLATYNAAGFVASLVVPVITDRRGRYAAGMVVSAACGVGFAVVLLLTDSLLVAAVGMVLLGAPAGVGATLLFADLRHGGASSDAIVRIRAVVSFAWVLGPPLSTLVASVAPEKSVLVLVGGIGIVNVLSSVLSVRAGRTCTTAGVSLAADAPPPTDASPPADANPPLDPMPPPAPSPPAAPSPPTERLRAGFRSGRVWAVLAVFVALQVLNGAAVTTMGLFVTRELHVPLTWSGVALGVSAFAEIPALLVIGRLMRTWSARSLIVLGASVGAVYYLAVAIVHAPLPLVLLQPLNAWFFATIAGVGLTVFQQTFAAPGFAAGLFANTRQVAAVLSGGLIALVVGTPDGSLHLYWICAGGAAAVAGLVAAASRRTAGATATAVAVSRTSS